MSTRKFSGIEPVTKKEAFTAMRLKRTYISIGAGLAFAAVSLFLTASAMNPGGQSEYNEGKKVYDTYCVACHGMDGAGNGPDAHRLKIKPTDFKKGVYRFKSTAGTALPTKGDIVRTLELGVRTTAMLPQLQLSHEQMEDVAGYVMHFCPKFRTEGPGKVVPIPHAPAKSAALIKEGKSLFSTCAVCHGTNGEGDGPIAATLKDDNGRPIRPANLTERPLKRANTPDEMYRTIACGIDGTPMASFEASYKPKQIWSLVYYIESITKTTRGGSNGMMGGRMMGGKSMMNGHMGVKLVGEEKIGAQIDKAAYHAWMMSEKK